MAWTTKQKLYLNDAIHRWNIKCGATRSGKTYLDYFLIPKRIRAVAGRDGLIFLLGNTKGTLQRNVIEPMQKIWGTTFVGDIRRDSTGSSYCMLFGQKAHCLGADNIGHVDKVRGSGVKYCYGDEIVSWHKEVFEMLKSRLDKPYSLFDGTCNPSSPSHWLKEFINSDADVFYQQYSIYDNEFLDPTVRADMEKEHTGVFFTRYILGEWARAEGIIYRLFSDDNKRYIIDDVQEYLTQTGQSIAAVFVGVDWGHNKSANTAVAVGITRNYKEAIILGEYYTKEEMDPKKLYIKLAEFLQDIIKQYGSCQVYGDNAEGMLVRGLYNTALEKGLKARVMECIKHPITSRIVLENSLFALDRIKIHKNCSHLIGALNDAVWDDKSDKDVRLDDGTSNIDSLDSLEYAICTVMEELETAGHIGR